MPAVGNVFPTLLDVASRLGPDGKVQKDLVELLNLSNEVLDDMPFYEANDGTTHKTSVRTGLPEPTWRLLNYGVQPTKSTSVPVRDSTGMLEDYAEIDKALADLNGNTASFRLSEDMAHIEGMNQSMQRTLFYGNTKVNPERFMGLAPRFSTKAGAASGEHVIDAGGLGADNTSIWLVGWGPNTVHGIYPKGSKAGLTQRDLGEVTLQDAEGGRYQGYRTHYKWDAGLVVRDWRYVVRIANIDVSELTADAATGADINDLMIQALEMLPNGGGGVKLAFYAGRTLRSFMRRQTLNGKNINLSLQDIAGKSVTAFDGIPVRKVDAILKTEARVV